MVTLMMEMKSQMQLLAHQQQEILTELQKRSRGIKPTPKLPDGIVLPLQTVEQIIAVEKKLKRSPEDKQMLVYSVTALLCCL